ncbi:hypothetical protein NMG60_11023445 [Bertholletia excelsa]
MEMLSRLCMAKIEDEACDNFLELFFQQHGSDNSLFMMYDLLHDLAKLPSNMGCLTNLRHLNIDQTGLKSMPPHMRRLESLQILTNMIMAEGGSSSGDLKDLFHLWGKLYIRGLQNVTSVKDAIGSRFEEKKHLDDLVLEWNSLLDCTRKETIETKVLDALQPRENWKRLIIKYYGGTEFPMWMRDPLFTELVCLYLFGCVKCLSLTSLSQIPLLKDLIVVEGMNEIELVVLEVLKFENKKKWKQWFSFGDEEIKGFLHPRELSIFRCPKLAQFSPIFLSLEKLRLKHFQEFCNKLNELPHSLPSLDLLESLLDLMSLTSLQINFISTATRLHEGILQQSSKLERLNIVDCGYLEALSRELVGLAMPFSLPLTLSSCPKLIALPGEAHNHPPILEYFYKLRVEGCPNLEFFPGIGLLPMLKRPVVQGCVGLKAFPGQTFCNNVSLEYLEIGNNCTNFLSLLPTILNLKYLERLEVTGCSVLESFPTGIWHTTNLRSVKIAECGENLQSIPHCIYYFKSLQELEVSWCPRLVSMPRQGLPINLISLAITDSENVQSYTSVEADKLDSLNLLTIGGIPDLPLLLLSAYHHLLIYLSEALQSVNKLETLIIRDCYKLR